MELTTQKENEITTVQLIGRIDSSVAKQFEEEFLKVIDAGNTRLIVSFAALDYISSAGLRVLLMGAKKIKTVNGKLALAEMKTPIREVFDVSGFSNMLTICQSVADAKSAMS